MRLLRLLLASVIVLLVMSVSNTAIGQVTYLTNYVVDGGHPGNINPDADATSTNWTTIITGPTTGNSWSPVTPIGFPFSFYGTAVTDFKVSGNGVVTFSTAATAIPSSNNTNLPAGAAENIPDLSILGFWDAFTGDGATASGDNVYVRTFGTAPNRQTWIKYFSYEYGSTGTAAVSSFTYWAIVLEETTNKVYVVDMNYHSGGASLTGTIGVQENATSAVQYGTNTTPMSAGSTGIPDNDYYVFTPVLLVNDNAGIESIDAPVSPLTTGVQNVEVTLKNHGLNALTSATVNWKVNGVLQTPYSYTGNLAQYSTASITLGSYNFVSGTTNLEVWSSLPNGLADNDVSNDTAMVSLCTSLSGTYTVGAGGDYATVAAAVAALNSCGISGPVTFNVAAGTYTGAFSIGQIAGSSAVNTVTFNGGSAATTTITHDGTGQYSTIRLNGADYVTFQNFTIANTGTTNGWGVHLSGGSDYNTIDNCIINLDIIGTSSNVIGVLASNSTTSNSTTGNNANYTTISNTTFNGGYYGVRLYGNTSATADQTNNKTSNCTFNNIYAYALYYYYQDNPIATGNIVNGTRATFGYGVYSTNSRHGVFTENALTGMKTYGIYLGTVNSSTQTPTQRTMVANNMVTALGTGDGIYMTGAVNVDIFHNSFTTETDQVLYATTTSLGYDIRNNIFASSGGTEVIDIDATPTAAEFLNYNIYYHSGTGNIGAIGAATYATLAAWQAADAVNNVNSLSGDPSFLGPTNLHAVGTLANNAATPIASVTTDIDGDARSATTPDIGADEYTPSSCAIPSTLGANSLTFTSAGLTWTAGGTELLWDVQWGAAGFTLGSGTVVSGLTTTSTSLTGLTGSTSYNFYVRADCGGATSPWAGPYTFFTGYCTPAPSSVDGSGITNVTMGGVNNTTGAEPGNYADYSAQVANAQQGVTLPISITYATGYTYNTWAWIDWNNDLDFTDAGEAYYLGESSNANPTTFSSSIAIPVTVAIGNYRIRIGGADSGLGTTAPSIPCYTGAYGTFEDYTLSVAAAPSCLPVSALTVSNLTATSASLGWTENGTATAWDIEWGAAGFTQGTGTLVTATATNPYALSGLSANTAYAYYVRANCGSSTSAWTGPFTFTTPCVAFTVPYFEGFETGYTHNTTVAGCLTQESVIGTSVWTANNILTTYNRAPRTGGWNAFLQYGNTDWLFIPISLTGGTSYTFEAYARQDFATTIDADLTVAYGTANNAAAMTNAIIATTGLTNGAYQQFIGAFTPTATGTYYIGIKGYMSGNPWYISLDDISVIATPTCPAPNALTTSNVTASSATVAWAGNATNYEVQYGAAGFTLGTGTTVNATTNTTSLTGLTFETNYNFYVRAICAVGDTSPWSGFGSFFTGYCTPAPSSVDAQGITNVSMGGINNTTVAEPGNYGNYSAQVGTAPQGGTLAINVTYQTGYTYDTWAWVDWNNDLDFTDAGEEYYLGNSTNANPTTLSGSITIPANALGNYRIRIGGSDTGLPLSPANPCYNGAYGAFEDYTLNVIIPAPALAPFALLTPANNAYVLVAGPAQNPIDISWQSAGSAATMYEWRANITGGSLNNPAVTLPADNMGMATTLSLNIQAVDNLLASFGVPIGDTAVLDWTVVAYSATGDSLFATTPYTVNLVRYGVSSPLLLNAPQNTNSTTTLRAPNGSASHAFMRAATVVLPTEFSNAGIAANTTIRNFGFNTNVPIPAGAVTGIFKLYLQNTTDVTYGKGTAWAGITPGMTEVFNDTITINGGGNGWDVVLDTLFAYAGNSVYVAYDWQLVANPLGTAISYYANTALVNGLVSASSTTAPPATLAGSSFRPEFAWGIDRDADDLEVVALYAMGKNPLGYSEPEQVQAIIRNNGYLPADKTVTLNITGANPYTTTENITLAPGQETTVAFSAYNPTTAGFNNMTVSVPSDQVTANNTQSWVQETTTNTFSYADSTLSGLGSVGYNTGDGLLLNRYYINGAASVNQIKVRIANNAASVGNPVYAVLMDTSGTIVSQSAPHTIITADLGTFVTFNLPAPVSVSDVDVFVGLAQPANATGYFPVSFQSENPTRPGAYFGADLNGANLGFVTGFRLMIEAVVSPACATTANVAVTNANCFGDANGSITVSVVGGTAPFNYLWNNGQTNATATGLVAAIYDVTITDANGCSLVATGTVGQPSAILLTTSSVSDTLSSGVGSASVIPTGGAAPYTYLWSDGQTTGTATGLVPGNYTVTITDANNCNATETVTVDNYTSTTRIDYVTNVSIYPNPTNGNAVIDLELSQNADVAVSIYTVTGVLVQDFGKENTSKATYVIDATEYPAGMYLVRFVVDNQVITKKLLVTK